MATSARLPLKTYVDESYPRCCSSRSWQPCRAWPPPKGQLARTAMLQRARHGAGPVMWRAGGLPPLRMLLARRAVAGNSLSAGIQQQVVAGRRSMAELAGRRLLKWPELYRAAQLAAWSGLCYLPASELEAAVAAENLQLVAHGRSDYTSWYIADGELDPSRFLSAALRGRAGPAPPHGGLPQRQRFVFVRGVQWSAPDNNMLRVWQGLARVWPDAFEPELTHPPGSLVAHSGVADLGRHLFEEVQPHVEEGGRLGLPVSFAGHSLGGALSTLLLAHSALRLRGSCPPRSLSCYTYGSPAVLAHQRGGGGGRALALLGVPQAQCCNFVLESDPIPRVMLSVDPYFALVKDWTAVQSLLQLRGWLLGDGSALSPSRFLFEVVGQLFFIRWHQQGGCEVLPLEPADIERELALPSPLGIGGSADGGGGLGALLERQARSWLDHHHGSYAQELEAAAIKHARAAAAAAGEAAAAAAAAPPAAGPPTSP